MLLIVPSVGQGGGSLDDDDDWIWYYLDAGLGVFSSMALPSGVRFGPYQGQRTDVVDSSYCWQVGYNSKSYR